MFILLLLFGKILYTLIVNYLQ